MALLTLEERLKKYPNCPVPVSTFTSFIDEGRIHYRAGHYRKALFCYDRALQLRPDDEGTLVARSQCHLKLGDAKSALKDAENSFSQQGSNNIMGLYHYGEALFSLGQFEQALIAYHRGYRRRKDKEEFRIGVNKAQDAIRTAIGDKQATQIEDLDTVLVDIQEMEDANKGREHCCVLTAETHHVNQDQHRSKKANALTFARARWVDREIMSVLQHDKDYLIKFLKRPDIRGDAQNSSEGLRDKATEALSYLDIREHFWRQQNPMYSRKFGLTFNNDMVRQYEKQERERMEASRRIKMDAAQGAVLKNLSHIEHALQIGRAQDCRLECERAIRQLKEIKILPRKPEFMTEILHFKGLALMKLKNFDLACATFQEEFKIALANKMVEVKSRALDFLGRSFALKGSFAEAAEIWDSKLAISKTHIERAYLYHEISRCYYETHKYDLARIYGNQCLDEALKISDDIWSMYAEILLAQCDITTKQFDKALPHLENAERYALHCNNKANISMLRESIHCIKIYMEKQEAGETNVPPESEQGSDDDKDELLV